MFKRNRKFLALIMAMVMLLTHMAAGAAARPNESTGTDFVAQYLAERGITHDELGIVGPRTAAPAAPAAPASGFTQGAGNGGFTPSTRVPHATMRTRMQQHSAQAASVRGWITIPGTNIDFPVNLNTANNSHYLYRDWRGNNYAGRLSWRNWNQFPDTATYLDFRTTVGNSWATTSRNINVYGHNWTNLRAPLRIGNHAQDRMFAQLKSYTNIEWAAANPHIYFSTPEMEGIWRVFAVGYAHTTPLFFYNNPNPTRAGMQTLIDEWRARSHINFNVDVNPDDRIITLTTCTRWHGEMLTQRYVVVARLLRPGESENDVVTATRNPNIRHPDFTQPVRLPRPAAAQAQAAQAQGTDNPTTPVAPADPAAAAAAAGAPTTLGGGTTLP